MALATYSTLGAGYILPHMALATYSPIWNYKVSCWLIKRFDVYSKRVNRIWVIICAILPGVSAVLSAVLSAVPEPYALWPLLVSECCLVVLSQCVSLSAVSECCLWVLSLSTVSECCLWVRSLNAVPECRLWMLSLCSHMLYGLCVSLSAVSECCFNIVICSMAFVFLWVLSLSALPM